MTSMQAETHAGLTAGLPDRTSQFGAVERRHQLTVDEFRKAYVAKHKPVIITGGVDDWPALSLWNEQYMREKYGSLPVRVEDRANLPPRVLRISLNEYLDAILSPSPGRPKYYLTETPLRRGNPILADIRIPSLCGDMFRSDDPLLWYGPEKTVSGLHFDLAHNLFVQLSGRKHVILIDPRQSKFVHANPWYEQYAQRSNVDTMNPNLLSHPLFARAEPLELIIEPGEMLYIPNIWWHDVRSLSVNISVNFFWMNAHRISRLPFGVDLLRAAVTGGLHWPKTRFHFMYLMGYMRNAGIAALKPLPRIPDA